MIAKSYRLALLVYIVPALALAGPAEHGCIRCGGLHSATVDTHPVAHVPAEAADWAAREELFTLFDASGPCQRKAISGPDYARPSPICVLNATAPVVYTGPIRAHTLRIIGPVTIDAPQTDAPAVSDVEIDAYELEFVGSEASLTINAAGRSIVIGHGEKFRLPQRGGAVLIRVRKVRYDEAAIAGLLARKRASDRLNNRNRPEAVEAQQIAEAEAFIRRAPIEALPVYFMLANNPDGSAVSVDYPAFDGAGFLEPSRVKDISDYFTPEVDARYVRSTLAVLQSILRETAEPLRTHNYGGLHNAFAFYNSLPRFSPAVKADGYLETVAALNEARAKLPPAWADQLDVATLGGLTRPVWVFYDLNRNGQPMVGPTELRVRPLPDTGDGVRIGSIRVNPDRSLAIEVTLELRVDPFLRDAVQRRLSAEKDEQLQGAFAAWEVRGLDIVGPGVTSSNCRSAGGLLVDCTISFQPDATLTDLLALCSDVGLPAVLSWRYAGRTAEGQPPIEGRIEFSLSLLRQTGLVVEANGDRLVNRSRSPVLVDYAQSAGSPPTFFGLTPAPALPAGGEAAWAPPAPGAFVIPPEAVSVAEVRDPLELMRRFRSVANETVLDWVQVTNLLPADDKLAKDTLEEVDLKVAYAAGGRPADVRSLVLKPAGELGSWVFLSFPRGRDPALSAVGVARYRKRGDVRLEIDTSSPSVVITDQSLAH